MICAQAGACTAYQGACVAGSDEDCQASQGCLQQGACILEGVACFPDQAGCQASQDCADLGRCSLNEGYSVCAALTDADCQGSAVCEEEGLCAAETQCADDPECEIWGQCIATE